MENDFSHLSVLLQESIDGLAIKPDGIYMDATFGRGGHSTQILKALSEKGQLIAIDRDLSAIEAAKMPTAIVTRNSLAASTMKVKQNAIAIDHVITREDYPAKPAPDALLAIANQWQIAPGQIMYVGDYLYDIQAANNAGMVACLITHGVEKRYQDLADIVIDELNQLLPFIQPSGAN